MELTRPSTPVITYGTYPALAAFTAVAVALTLRWNLDRTMVIAVLAIVPLVVALIVEWRHPLSPRWAMTRRSLVHRDLPFIAAAVVAQRLAETAGLAVAAGLAAPDRGFGPLARLPLGLQVVAALLAFDLAWYGWHRAAHRHPRLWRIHGVHHAPAQVYALVHLVFHPLDLLVSRLVIATVVFRFSGVAPDAVFVAVVVVALQQMISHVNADLRIGPLNYVLIGAETHRYHHSAHHHGNYGSVTPVWDLLFGTFVYTPTRVPDRLGLDDPTSFPDPARFHRTLAWPLHPGPLPGAQAR